jgi:hypothetical protein
MGIEKVLLSATENHIEIGVPFTKFDKANRKVSGWATIDNIDQSGDVLTAEASIAAFEAFRGNVREQHDKNKAIGKVVNFEQKDFYDQGTGELYSGIYVTAYVSKGAQDTWEKVLDGTLSGFSVKGSIVKQHSEYIPDEDKTIRFIDRYFLEELSLVDSPCNQLCNVFSIEKTVDGVSIHMSDELSVDTENVFFCEKDGIAILSKDDSESCTRCDTEMKNAGWMESVAGENKIEKIKDILSSSGFTKSNDDLSETKGGSEMADEVQNDKVEATEEVVTSEVVTENAKEEVTPEEDTHVVEPDLQLISKALEEIKVSLAKVGEDRENSLSQIKETVEGVEKSVETRMTDLLKQHTELASEFKGFKDGLNNVEKRLETFEGSTAFKKSLDVTEESTEIKKSADKDTFWSTAFLPNKID